MRKVILLLIAFFWGGIVSGNALGSGNDTVLTHAITMNGSPKYPSGFTHFEYADPLAPKGGTLRDFATGTFDSFNPYILKGRPAEGTDLVYDTLLVPSGDEPATYYGLAAQKIEMPQDMSWVIFHLHPRARFHDNHPVTADDVIFSFHMLKDNFGNFLKRYYKDIKKAEALDRLCVKFTFKNTGNRELPVVMGQIPVIPEHYWKHKDFSRGGFEIPLGSGPYKIRDFKVGKNITYERVKDYWAKDLPVMKGRYNFDIIRYEYFRDTTVALEAFKAGLYDYRFEYSAKNWATMYRGSMFDSGEIQKIKIPHSLPVGMQGLVFNTRRWLFRDRLVRRALMHAFDYEWANRQLYYGQYKRINSYFSNCDLQSPPLPGIRERKILKEFESHLPEHLFSEPYHLPRTDGSGYSRKNLILAANLLNKAGWQIRDGKLVNKKSHKPFRFQFLSDSTSMDKLILPFRRNLKRLGIEMQIHRVDSPQYILRLRKYDFDMISASFGARETPGIEQKLFWHSSSAARTDSRNFAGIADPVVDSLVDRVIAAQDRNQLIPLVHALDRVLLWGEYIIPTGASDCFRLAYRDKFGRPAVFPDRNPGVSSWWQK